MLLPIETKGREMMVTALSLVAQRTNKTLAQTQTLIGQICTVTEPTLGNESAATVLSLVAQRTNKTLALALT